MIDLRWGITDEAKTDNLTNEICIDEIKRCHTESLASSFMVLRID